MRRLRWDRKGEMDGMTGNSPGVEHSRRAENAKDWDGLPTTKERSDRSGLMSGNDSQAYMHVLTLQMKDLNLGKIIRGNREVEDQSSSPGDIKLLAGQASRKIQSAGQDPWGDKALPEKSGKESEEDTEGDKTSSEYSGVCTGSTKSRPK